MCRIDVPQAVSAFIINPSIRAVRSHEQPDLFDVEAGTDIDQDCLGRCELAGHIQ